MSSTAGHEPVVVRDATTADAAACAAIYAPYVEGTTVSFEVVPPGVDEMARRVGAALASHAFLVAEVDGVTVGYAYAGPYAAREAYRWACETSVYLAPAARGRGLGRILYTALLDRLTERGFRQVVAGYTLPNPASAGLHASLGFEPAGTFRAVGWKLGAWRDVTKVQRALGPGAGVPPADAS